MADVVIYTRPFCGFCARALKLLGDKKIAFAEIEAGMDANKRREMVEKSGRTTFPQIFIGGVHVGGCDELLTLERTGKLDPLLSA